MATSKVHVVRPACHWDDEGSYILVEEIKGNLSPVPG
jgi:hypothetical protein